MSVKIVKSVGRVFEILELFEAKQKSMSITEISKALNYPHSSTLSILKSMETLGYLEDAPEKFSYFPSEKLVSLTSWLSESVENETDIRNFMLELHENTGETINISKLTGDYVKILFGYLGNHAITINVREGTLMPTNSSFVGFSALATLPDKKISEILLGLQDQNIVSDIPDDKIRLLIATIRKKKIAAGYDLFIQGISAITIPVWSEKKKDVLIIGVVGPTDRIRSHEGVYKKLISKLLKKHRLKVVGRQDD